MELNFTEEDFENKLLPVGEYVASYQSADVQQLGNGFVKTIFKFKVDSGDYAGDLAVVELISSPTNQRLTAIAKSIQIRIFTALLGKENFELWKTWGDTDFVKNLKLKMTADIVADNYSPFNSERNVFKGFKCILSDDEKNQIQQELINKLGEKNE